MTMVAGKILVDDAKLLDQDIEQLIEQVNQAAPALFRRRQEWLDKTEGAIKRSTLNKNGVSGK